MYFPERGIEYRPGLSLMAGAYRTEITKEGFQDIETRITVSPPNAEFHFDLSAVHHTLEVTTDPDDAQVRLVGTTLTYRSGMELPQDRYRITVSRQGYVPQDLTIDLVQDFARHVALERNCRTVQVPKTECRDVTRHRDETRSRFKRLSEMAESSFLASSRSVGCENAWERARKKAEDNVKGGGTGGRLEDVSFSSCDCSRGRKCKNHLRNLYTGEYVCVEYRPGWRCEATITYRPRPPRRHRHDFERESYTKRVPYTEQVCEEITVDEQQCESL